MIAPQSVPDDLQVMVESEVAFYLRQRLGPIRVWPFVVTSLRRLGCDNDELPFAFRSGRRYYYTEQDVIDFANRFEVEHPEVERRVPVQGCRAADVAPTYPKTRVRPGLRSPAVPQPTLH